MLLRLCLALFLLIPTPVFANEVPGEVTVNEGFEDSTYETGLTVSTGSIYCDEQDRYGTTGCSLGIGSSTLFEFSEDVYEVGFIVGAVNNSYDVKYYYSDGTDETIQKSGQDNSEGPPWANMVDSFYKSFTDYNNDEANTDKFITKFEVNVSDPTVFDTLYWQYIDESTITTTTTTTTIPPAVPDNATSVSVNYNGEGIDFSWEYTNGNVNAHSFHINYSYDNSTWTRVIIDDTSARTFHLKSGYVQTGTFYWSFSVCGDLDNGESCTDSDSNNFETTQYVAPTTTVYVAPPLPPPPPPPTPQEIIVDVVVEGVDKTYTQADVNDGTIERDQERIDNESEFGCFMTNAQIERGDCFIIIEEVEVFEDDIIEEEIIITEKEVIVEEIKENVDVIILEDDVDVLDPPKEEVFEDAVVEFEELPIEFEIIEFDLEDIAPEIVVEIPIQDEIEEEIIDEEIEVEVQEVLDEPIQEVVSEDTPGTTLPRVEDKEPIELTEEEVAVEVAEIDEVIVIELEIASEEEIEEFTEEELVEYEKAKEEAIQEYVQDLTNEEASEVLEEVNDIGVQNLDQATEEIQEVVQAVVEEAIADVAELTEEQVEVVAEVLQVEAEDVAIIAESVKDDEVIAEAVEEYVERAVENTDVENYTLADVVTEISYESFIDNPIETFVDFNNLGDITVANIGDDMTQDQKEKAQEVVVPVILTRIASMAAFMFRRS